MIAAQDFNAADIAAIEGDMLIPCSAAHLGDATIMRPIKQGEEITITPFTDFMKWHISNGWHVPGPFMAVSANLRAKLNG